MSVTIILTCDICGTVGHAVNVPSPICIKSLKDRIAKLSNEQYLHQQTKALEYREYTPPLPKIWMGCVPAGGYVK